MYRLIGGKFAKKFYPVFTNHPPLIWDALFIEKMWNTEYFKSDLFLFFIFSFFFFFYFIFIRSFLEASFFTSFSKIETKTSKTIYFRSLFPGSGAFYDINKYWPCSRTPSPPVIFKYHAIDNDNSVRVIREPSTPSHQSYSSPTLCIPT